MKLFEIFGDVVLKGGKEAEKDIENLDKKGGSLAKTLGSGAMALGGVLVGVTVALGGMAKKAVESTDRIDKLSQKIGLSREGFQEWDYILSQNGVSVEVLQGGMKTLTNQIDNLSKGGKGATEAFEALGLSYDDIQGKSQEEVFNMTVQALQSMEDETKRAALANELLGRSGTELAPLLNQTAEATNNLKNRAHELGLVMGNEAIDAGVLLSDTMDDVKKTFGAFVTQIGVHVMPVIQKFLDWVLSNMPVIENTFKVVFGVISDVVKFLYDFFEENMLPIFQLFYDWVMGNMPAIQATANMVFDKIVEVATTLYEFFNEYILPIFTQLFEWVMGHMPTIQETAQKMFNRIIRVATLMWEFFKENILPILATFYEWVQSNMPLIQSIVESVFKAIFTVAELVWDFFEYVLIPVFKALWDFISPTFPLMQAVVENTFGAILTTVESLASGFETMIGWVKSAVEWIEKFNKTKVEEKDVSSGGGHGGISSGLSQFTGGKRALGGPVNAGQTYMVGERGPELVTFGRSGTVTPNHELGGQGINITINNPVMTDKRMVDEIGKQLVSTLRAKGLVTT